MPSTNIGGKFVVASATFWTKAWPMLISRTERNCLRLRIGRSRAISRP